MSNAEKKGSMSISRRDFLKAGGAIGAGLAFAPVILGEAAKAPSKDLNVAFIPECLAAGRCRGRRPRLPHEPGVVRQRQRHLRVGV